MIVYSAYSGYGLVLAARAAGADGIVDKAETVQDLLAAIRGAVSGELALPAVPRDAYEAALAALEDEDLPVLAMLLDGASLDAMAEALRKSRPELSWRSQRIVGRLSPVPNTRCDVPAAGPGRATRSRRSRSRLLGDDFPGR